MNIVKLAMGFIGPAVASRIASMLGINNTLVNRAISTALPAILAGFATKSQSSGGLGSLFDMIRGQDTRQLNDLGSILGGSNAGDFARSGQDMLGGLLGGDGLGSLVGALSKQTGLDRGQSESIFGLLGPVAAGSIGQVVQEQNLDAQGLAGFLAAQKDNISDAMPNEMAQELGGSGLLDGFDLGKFGLGAAAAGAGAAVAGAADRAFDGAKEAVSDAADAVGRTADTAYDAARDTTARATDAARSGGGWLKWLLPLLILAGLAWYFLGNRAAPEMSGVELPSVEQLSDLNVGGVAVGEQFNTAISGLTESLGSVTDVASAREALPALQEAEGSLGQIAGAMGSAPAEAKSAIAGVAATALASLKPVIDTVLAIPGVGDVLKPVLDSVVQRLESLEG